MVNDTAHLRHQIPTEIGYCTAQRLTFWLHRVFAWLRDWPGHHRCPPCTSSSRGVRPGARPGRWSDGERCGSRGPPTGWPTRTPTGQSDLTVGSVEIGHRHLRPAPSQRAIRPVLPLAIPDPPCVASAQPGSSRHGAPPTDADRRLPVWIAAARCRAGAHRREPAPAASGPPAQRSRSRHFRPRTDTNAQPRRPAPLAVPGARGHQTHQTHVIGLGSARRGAYLGPGTVPGAPAASAPVTGTGYRAPPRTRWAPTSAVQPRPCAECSAGTEQHPGVPSARPARRGSHRLDAPRSR